MHKHCEVLSFILESENKILFMDQTQNTYLGSDFVKKSSETLFFDSK